MSAKINLDLSSVATGLDGKPLDDTKPTYGKILAEQVLARSTEKGEATQLMLWSFSLYEDGKVELDSSQYEKLRRMVDEAQMFALVKAPILNAMTAAKDASEKDA